MTKDTVTPLGSPVSMGPLFTTFVELERDKDAANIASTMLAAIEVLEKREDVREDRKRTVEFLVDMAMPSRPETEVTGLSMTRSLLLREVVGLWLTTDDLEEEDRWSYLLLRLQMKDDKVIDQILNWEVGKPLEDRGRAKAKISRMATVHGRAIPNRAHAFQVIRKSFLEASESETLLLAECAYAVNEEPSEGTSSFYWFGGTAATAEYIRSLKRVAQRCEYLRKQCGGLFFDPSIKILSAEAARFTFTYKDFQGFDAERVKAKMDENRGMLQRLLEQQGPDETLNTIDLSCTLRHTNPEAEDEHFTATATTQM